MCSNKKPTQPPSAQPRLRLPNRWLNASGRSLLTVAAIAAACGSFASHAQTLAELTQSQRQALVDEANRARASNMPVPKIRFQMPAAPKPKFVLHAVVHQPTQQAAPRAEIAYKGVLFGISEPTQGGLFDGWDVVQVGMDHVIVQKSLVPTQPTAKAAPGKSTSKRAAKDAPSPAPDQPRRVNVGQALN